MAVTSEQVRQSYAGNDVTTVFAVPWMFRDQAALLVIVRTTATGAEAVKTLTTHYTVAGVDDPAGGTLTMLTAPATGETLHIIHNPELKQPLDLSAGSGFPAETFEEQLDRAVHQNQRTRDLVTRVPSLGETDTDGSGAYDAKANRIENLANPTAGQDAVTRAYALATFASASGPAALPPDGSLGNAKWDPSSPLALTNMKGLTTAEQQVETNPLALADDASHLVSHQKMQFQMLAVLNWLDAGARAHAFEAIAASNLPAVVAAAIAAAATGAGNEWINGSCLVSQRYPSEAATLLLVSTLDAYFLDEVFLLATGGNPTVNRVAAGLHSAAISPLGIELVGAAGVTNLAVGQRIGRRRARRLGALLASKNVTIGVKVRHSGTTGSITPNLVVRTTSHTGDEAAAKFAAGSMTTRLTQAFPGALAAGGEVSFTHTFDLGGMTDSQNGFEIYVDLLATNAATIKFTLTDFWISNGNLSTSLMVDDFDETLQRCLPAFDKTAAYGVAVTTMASGAAGFSDAIAATGDDSLETTFSWKHLVPMRFAGTLATYNPSAAAATPRNHYGNNGVIVSAVSGERASYVRFTSTGNKESGWHIHGTHDSSFYD